MTRMQRGQYNKVIKPDTNKTVAISHVPHRARHLSFTLHRILRGGGQCRGLI